MNDSPVDCQNASVTESKREPRHPAVSNENNEIKPLYVILSEENREAVFGVEVLLRE